MNLLKKITLKTPESVELKFTLAGIGKRAYAVLLDYIIWLLLLMAWTFISFIFIYNTFSEVLGDNNQLGPWFFSFYLLIFFLIYVGYFIFFEVWWQGKTPGKRFVNIRVIRDDGKPARLPQATLRALLRPVDDLFFLGLFFIVLGKREKRLGDWLAGTVVIQEEQKKTQFTFSPSPTSQDLAEQLKNQVNINQLRPEEFLIIRLYLERRDQMFPEARYSKAKELAYQVKDILELDGVPEGVTAFEFLAAVYLAYQEQEQTISLEKN
ncbi:RDD family protein [Spirulina sp. CS-785/01]|uniref:RDD family protein n=1 Tax=Spirulina sp. CS-785/01 TaxID=3021716 RepID=UPI00232F3CBC|nr:RDD family protein [Spirulina sp. CS-785/01]MDB9314229.1 RDD family protein [Spirulina sp. CS-785/01]